MRIVYDDYSVIEVSKWMFGPAYNGTVDSSTEPPTDVFVSAEDGYFGKIQVGRFDSYKQVQEYMAAMRTQLMKDGYYDLRPDIAAGRFELMD